jgi:hypothetical protein
MSLEIGACWYVMLHCRLVFPDTEEEGSTFIQNVRNHHLSNTASHPSQPEPSTKILLSKPQMLLTNIIANSRADVIQLVMLCPLLLFKYKCN